MGNANYVQTVRYFLQQGKYPPHFHCKAYLLVQNQIPMDGGGAFNCLFTDGLQLFGYRDHHGGRPLHFLKRKTPFSRTILRDQDMEINFNLGKSADEEGIIVATGPLADENVWKEFSPSQLLVIQSGHVAYTTTGT